MNIPTDNGALINRVIDLEETIEKLEKQARKSICQSCVSMTNEAHNQDCIIEDLTVELVRVKSLKDELLKENDYLRKSAESARGDTKSLQRFIKNIGQTKVYDDCFKREAI